MKLSEEMKATIKKYDDYTDLGEMTQYLRTRASALEVILPKVIELEAERDELYEALKFSNQYLITTSKARKNKSLLLDARIEENKYLLLKSGNNEHK